MPGQAMGSSRLLIDGDRFRTESPEATYEGLFNIDVEAQPHEIDIEFVEGPEAGTRITGSSASTATRSSSASTSAAGPVRQNSTPSTAAAMPSRRSAGAPGPARVRSREAPRPPAPAATVAADGDGPVRIRRSGPTIHRLQGDWSAVKLVRDGQETPSMILATGRRQATKNELKISFGGQLVIHALVRIDETQDPIHVDYYNVGGFSRGTAQQGIMKWVGDDACFCMAAPGRPRPTDFEGTDGQTLSQWRPQS